MLMKKRRKLLFIFISCYCVPNLEFKCFTEEHCTQNL